jgi:hypothetical protein
MTTVDNFRELFSGRSSVHGRGKRGCVHKPVTHADYETHLDGLGEPLGIYPMLEDGHRVNFCAIDLDEPNYEAAKQFVSILPGKQLVEVSQSGNYHIWSFFTEPIEAWIVRGIMRTALDVIECKAEIYPKQDQLREDMVGGNYIQLPSFGGERPLIDIDTDEVYFAEDIDYDTIRNDPSIWEKRAARLGIEQSVRAEAREQGTRTRLHCCAEHIIANRFSNPIVEGGRHVVLFNLAKMLVDYEGFSDEEAANWLHEVNEASPDPLLQPEIDRIFGNAKRGGFTSTGCDDPYMAAYVDPTCHIAKRGI